MGCEYTLYSVVWITCWSHSVQSGLLGLQCTDRLVLHSWSWSRLLITDVIGIGALPTPEDLFVFLYFGIYWQGAPNFFFVYWY